MDRYKEKKKKKDLGALKLSIQWATLSRMIS